MAAVTRLRCPVVPSSGSRPLSATPLRVSPLILVTLAMVVMASLPCSLATLLPRDESMAKEVSAAVLDVMEAVEGSVGVAVGAAEHTVITLTDPAAPDLLATATHLTRQSRARKAGRTHVVLPLPNATTRNISQANSSTVLTLARRMRLLSRAVTVVVAAESGAFLSGFAQWALDHRLLVWGTRLLVVTSLSLSDLLLLMRTHWTFSMMNMLLMNVEHTSTSLSCGLYTHLPYTPRGPLVVRLASWTPARRLVPTHAAPLFPDKFTNFYGAHVNITALPFPPYWDERESAAGRYHGTDYLMINAIGLALNFTVTVLPSATWSDVTDRVKERVSFVATVIYAVFPQRLEHYDYSYMFEYAFHAFCMARPELKPRWQSLYYPLHDYVWALVLAVLLLMPFPFILISRAGTDEGRSSTTPTATGQLILTVAGSLLGQELASKFSPGVSGRLLAGAWLLFAFVLASAYRGNLTASLTAPKYPPRVETLEQLVDSEALVTMPPYGAQFRDFFKESESSDFKTLGERVKIVPTATEGLLQATSYRQAHMEARRYLELEIARRFTRPDGSSSLYVARESVFPGLSAWPVPHDAPYKPALDRVIMAIKEGGLYEKWSRDVLSEARQESLQEQPKDQSRYEAAEAPSGGDVRALTLTHMQGPLLLLLLGLAAATLAFLLENMVKHCY